ncbi:AmmeMemoRadiSam system protein B [Photobacterium sanctipauli]|uniref:MEMO1 family protein C9I98_18870 n=1 Tax=Photobacterium sanctipauli TaxID=1342794 RepID=A0A2T3NNN7_9GAMM|nr:AmmeMemoRadiSam system protein B [Photobacterium sanctipauli]PSW17588.1 AmmeMemoRadiSam system protein B [Photobacterium sanctipauli]
MRIRHPAVAGRFYTHSPEQLQQQLTGWLSQPESCDQPIRALIVPHAGYVFSGAVAAQAYQYLNSQADRIKKVILIGPSHRHYFRGCALPAADYFETPLGRVAIDTQSVEKLREIEDIEVSEQVHALEHSLEVQLPFLQTCLNDFTLLPLLTSNVSPAKVATLIDKLWQEDNCLLVVSSDLSHFHSYKDAQHIDSHTCNLIERYEPSLTPEQACGSTGINTLLLLAKKRGYQLTRKALINSGDTKVGDKERVVGYVSYLVSEP